MTVFNGIKKNVNYRPYRKLTFFEDLNEEEKEFTRSLNRTLRELEHKIKKEIIALQGKLKAKIEKDRTGFKDFDLDCSITFFMNENDPGYKEGKNDIMANLVWSFGLETYWEFGIADGQNHTACSSIPDEENHCMLMHSLHHHSDPDLGWRDILRIGSIQTNIVLNCEYKEK